MLKIALRFIRYDKAKSIGALLGIVISLFLIGQQGGVFLFLSNATSSLVDNTACDLWVVDNRTTNVNALAQLDLRQLYAVASLPGVRAAHPMVIAGGSARLADGTNAAVQIVGSPAPRFPGGPARFAEGRRANLLADDAVSFDQFDSKALFNQAGRGTVLEINGKRAFFAAASAGTRGFGAAYLFTTLERARRLGNVPTTKLSAILVDLQPGADSVAVRDAITRTVFGVRAWLPGEFSAATQATVIGSSSIGLSVGSLIVFAVVAGFFIIGLTLYSAATDRIRDYGTMKAIGASNGYVARLIMLQASLFAGVGYVVGSLLIEGFRYGIGQAGLPFQLSLAIRAGLLGVTLLISLGGAVFAIRRINGVEPASVFRG